MTRTWVAGRVIGVTATFDERSFDKALEIADREYPYMLQKINEQINGCFFEWLDGSHVSNESLLARTTSIMQRSGARWYD